MRLDRAASCRRDHSHASTVPNRMVAIMLGDPGQAPPDAAPGRSSCGWLEPGIGAAALDARSQPEARARPPEEPNYDSVHDDLNMILSQPSLGTGPGTCSRSLPPTRFGSTLARARRRDSFASCRNKESSPGLPRSSRRCRASGRRCSRPRRPPAIRADPSSLVEHRRIRRACSSGAWSKRASRRGKVEPEPCAVADGRPTTISSPSLASPGPSFS